VPLGFKYKPVPMQVNRAFQASGDIGSSTEEYVIALLERCSLIGVLEGIRLTRPSRHPSLGLRWYERSRM
jgi:hypothetical protein